jgi:hypothetical protein
MSKKHKTTPSAVEPAQPAKQMIEEYIGTIKLPVDFEFYVYSTDVDELIKDLIETIDLLRQAQAKAWGKGLVKLGLVPDVGKYHLSGQRLETDKEFTNRLECEREKLEDRLKQKPAVLEQVRGIAATMTQEELLAAWKEGQRKT